MFFFFSIFPGEKKFSFNFRGLCPVCKNYDDFGIVMTYTSFSVFFIPLFKASKRYFLKAEKCGAVCEITENYAKRLLSGEDTLDLNKIPFISNYRKEKYCENCGFRTTEDFVYCPRCSEKLK